MDEIETRFATTLHRRWLFGGFQRVVAQLIGAGCATIFLDGSFVTGKPDPGDFDGCWDMAGVDYTLLDPVLLDFVGKREAQKAKYFGEMFPILLPGQPGNLPLFQNEKFSARPKGILRVDLGAPKGPNA